MSLYVWHYLHYFLVESKSCRKLLSLLEAHKTINYKKKLLADRNCYCSFLRSRNSDEFIDLD